MRERSIRHVASSLSWRLRLARERKGLSQTELAALLGRGQSFVSNYERSERRLGVAEFVFIARALEMDIAVELTGLLDELNRDLEFWERMDRRRR